MIALIQMFLLLLCPDTIALLLFLNTENSRLYNINFKKVVLYSLNPEESVLYLLQITTKCQNKEDYYMILIYVIVGLLVIGPPLIMKAIIK